MDTCYLLVWCVCAGPCQTRDTKEHYILKGKKQEQCGKIKTEMKDNQEGLQPERKLTAQRGETVLDMTFFFFLTCRNCSMFFNTL